MASLPSKLSKKFIYLDEGTTRIVYRHGDWVIKIPKNDDGIIANEIEYHRFRRRNLYLPKKLARCRLIYSCSVLVMEYVDDISMKEWPDWVGEIDSAQVGKNRKGEIVAYDYGD